MEKSEDLPDGSFKSFIVQLTIRDFFELYVYPAVFVTTLSLLITVNFLLHEPFSNEAIYSKGIKRNFHVDFDVMWNTFHTTNRVKSRLLHHIY